MGSRRLTPPWAVDEATESFCIRDANGQALAAMNVSVVLLRGGA